MMQHTYTALEPAAHLDPGPDGHNVYGKEEHALTRVVVPLDIQDTLLRLSCGRKSEGSIKAKLALLHSRNLLTRYLLGTTGAQFWCHHSFVKALVFIILTFFCVFMHSTYIYIDTASAIEVMEVSSLPDNIYIPTNLKPLHPSQLHTVIAAYNTAIDKISGAGPVRKELTAQAMHELGDILLHSGNTRCVYIIIGQR